MDKNACKELVILLQQMINDKVQLIHGGQIIGWEDTKIPEILQKIKNEIDLPQNSIFENNDN